MQQAVRGEGRAARLVRSAVQAGEATPGLLDDHLHGGRVPALKPAVDRRVRGALGDEHVHPEVAEAPRDPAPLGEREEPVGDSPPRELARARVAERRVLDPADRGDVDPAVVAVGALAARRPPALAERRGGRDADHRPAVALERDERRPDRDPADEVPRAVDRVDDPTRVRLLAAALLAEEALGRPPLCDRRPQRLLDRVVGVRDGRQVGLLVDTQIRGAEPRQRERVGEVGELVREGEIWIDGRA